MLVLKKKKIRKYIGYVLVVLLIAIPILFRYEILQKKETSDYTCKVMIDRWRSGCVFCYQATVDDIEGPVASYVVKRNNSTVIRFRLMAGELKSYIYKEGPFKENVTLINDTLHLTVHVSATYNLNMKVPMDGKKYKVKDIPIKGKYTGGHEEDKPSEKRMKEIIKYIIRDY
jgi:hypothetical protein